MSECEENSCCPNETSCSVPPSTSEECCTLAEDLMCLAKAAKHELLKDKMKRLLEAKIGKKLDNVAEVVVEAMLTEWQHKMAGKEACNTYHDALNAALKG